MKGECGLKDEKRNLSDKRFLHPTLTEKQIQGYIKKAHWDFYTPRKIYHIICMLGVRAAFTMFFYSYYTKLMF